MIKWASIGSFSNIAHWIFSHASYHGAVPPMLRFSSKVKLHGTNAGVRIHADKKVFAQSRTRTLTVSDDNMGFAKWVDSQKEFFSSLLDSPYLPDISFDKLVVFGEWCGNGIAKGVSISGIDQKIFAVFAIEFHLNDETSYILYEPSVIETILGATEAEVYVLPWHSSIDIDFDNKLELQKAVDQINEMVQVVENNDPWVYKTFGLEGTGEGLVWYPILEEGAAGCSREDFSRRVFKTKGEKHRVKKQRMAAEIKIEFAKDIEDFVDKFLTEARLEQGLVEACNGIASKQNIGPFLKWITNDIRKESVIEFEALDIEWKR